MDLEIRSFKPADENAVVAIWNACGLVMPWNDPHRDIERKLKVQPDLFLVGLTGEKVIASVMAGYEGHRGWINYLAVDPEYRKQGIGRQMMARAEASLLALGCPKINLQVRSKNIGVIEFYRRLGFSPDDVVSFGKRLIPDKP